MHRPGLHQQPMTIRAPELQLHRALAGRRRQDVAQFAKFVGRNASISNCSRTEPTGGFGMRNGAISLTTTLSSSKRFFTRPLIDTTWPGSRTLRYFVYSAFQIIASMLPLKSSSLMMAKGLPSFLLNFLMTSVSDPAAWKLGRSSVQSWVSGTYLGCDRTLR